MPRHAGGRRFKLNAGQIAIVSASTKQYFTGYLASDWYLYPLPPYKGRSWYVTFKDTEKCSGKEIVAPTGVMYQAKEVVIHSRSIEMAKNAFDLINCAVLLESGQAPFGEIDDIEPEDAEERQLLSEEELRPRAVRFIETDGFPVACMIAAKASHRRELQYALAKFRLATLLFSQYMVDLDPSNHGFGHLGTSPFISRHVQYGNSIMLSYSVIEEIGLEIRANQDNPSQINGKWNPKCRNDLERRLTKAHVDLRAGIYWHRRGKPTRVQRAKSYTIIKRLPFARGPFVRDAMIDICDAILQASFLRSKISSHKASALTKSLTPLDSENVRHLARYLLLARVGFWKYKNECSSEL